MSNFCIGSHMVCYAGEKHISVESPRLYQSKVVIIINICWHFTIFVLFTVSIQKLPCSSSDRSEQKSQHPIHASKIGGGYDPNPGGTGEGLVTFCSCGGGGDDRDNNGDRQKKHWKPLMVFFYEQHEFEQTFWHQILLQFFHPDDIQQYLQVILLHFEDANLRQPFIEDFKQTDPMNSKKSFCVICVVKIPPHKSILMYQVSVENNSCNL